MKNENIPHLTIALVGRPNVGKSTLFNRLAGRRQAIVDDRPGVTVDRHFARGRFFECEYTIIDTGGFEPETSDDLLIGMREQSLLAIEQADIIFAIFDGKEGLVPADREIVDMLRRSEKIVYYLVNKIDGPKHEGNVADFYSLGLDNLQAISAEHGVNVGDLLSDLERDHPSAPLERERGDGEIRVAVIGKPNVGKSTLVNRLIGEDRHLVTNIAGTTRDAIDSILPYKNHTIRLIDTAGIRRKKNIKLVLEKRTIVKALKAMDRADVALLMIDSEEGVTEQDLKIAGFAHDKGLSSLILVNKWDLIEKDQDTAGSMAKDIRERLKFIPYASIVFISAQSGQRVHTILDRVVKANEGREKRVTTGELNRWLERSLAVNQPPTRKGRPLKIYFISQVDTCPPTFMLSVNNPDALHFSYKRFLHNRLREEFGFESTPIKIFARTHGKKTQDLAEQELDRNRKSVRKHRKRR